MTRLLLILLSLSIPVYATAAPVPWQDFFVGHAWFHDTAGVLYFKADLDKNSNKMCDDIRDNPWRLTMIDQESEEVSRLKGNAVPPGYVESIHMNLADFKAHVDKVAQNLTSFCLRVNLAPVADQQQGPRSYKNPEYAKVFAQSMNEHHITPTWKHFPGMNRIQGDVYHNSQYSNLYKNIYGEGVIDRSTLKEITADAVNFKTNSPDMVMFSIGLYPAIYNKPIVFSPDMWTLLENTQPHSLYMVDDLSELNLSDNDILWLFQHLDFFLFTNPQDIFHARNVLEKFYQDGRITHIEITKKIERQNKWRALHNYPLLPAF